MLKLPRVRALASVIATLLAPVFVKLTVPVKLLPVLVKLMGPLVTLKLTFPADTASEMVRPSKPVQLTPLPKVTPPAKELAVSPSLKETLASNLVAPAGSVEVIPLAAATVL